MQILPAYNVVCAELLSLFSTTFPVNGTQLAATTFSGLPVADRVAAVQYHLANDGARGKDAIKENPICHSPPYYYRSGPQWAGSNLEKKGQVPIKQEHGR